MAVVNPVLPAMGPLVGASFDKAFTIMAQRWRNLAMFAVIGIVAGAFNFFIAYMVGMCFIVYWYYHSLANAVRLIDPTYNMTANHVLRLIGLNIVYGICVEIGIILLIVPGIYVANKWSLANMIAVKDDAPVGAALSRSWSVTDPFFWPTLGFNILSGLGVFAVAFVGGIIAEAIFFAAISSGADPTQTYSSPFFVSGIRGMAAAIGLLAYFYAIAYTYQAKDIAMMNWYNGLRAAFGLQ